jgi:hypothetical protein
MPMATAAEVATTAHRMSERCRGGPGIDPHAMAMPKGRDPGVAYSRKFVEDAKSEGLVKAAIESAAIRGAVVAPPE